MSPFFRLALPCWALTYPLPLQTRLPSNLRQDHLRMHAFTCVHFRLHDKDGGYTIRSTVPENPMLQVQTNITALFDRMGVTVLPTEVLYCWNMNLQPLGLDLITFKHELDP